VTEWQFCKYEFQGWSDHAFLGFFSMHQLFLLSPLSQTSIFVVFKLWKVTHGGTSYFFTFSTCFWHFMSLGQQLLLVFTFSTLWVTFILKHFRFWWLFSLFFYYPLLIFVCCTILSFQYQFEVIWTVELQILLRSLIRIPWGTKFMCWFFADNGLKPWD